MKTGIYPEIRLWNKTHPKKKIEIVGFDMEHSFWETINLILEPYLRKVRPDADYMKYQKDTLSSYFKLANVIINEGKEKHITGKYPFETPEYMETVVASLKFSAPLKLFQKPRREWMWDREEIIKEIIVSSKFLGNKMITSKTFLKCGSAHLLTHSISKSVLAHPPFGYFLTNQYAPTKGKFYAINLNTVGISIEDSVRRIDPRLNILREQNLIDMHKRGKLGLNQPILSSYISLIDNYFVKLNYKYPGNAFYIKGYNYKMIQDLKMDGLSHFGLVVDLAYQKKDVDATIVVPFGSYWDN